MLENVGKLFFAVILLGGRCFTSLAIDVKTGRVDLRDDCERRAS